MGVDHFQKLGADVNALRVIDKDSANDPQWEPLLENADLIYFSGGDPGHLFQTMHESRAWKAAQRAWEHGAVYAGCSAGAMILADRIPRFRIPGTVDGFGVVPAKFVVPHSDAIPAMFRPLAFALRGRLEKDKRMIGVDEDTALVGKLGGEWRVMGRSKVHIYTREGVQEYESGQSVILD
jgi:cyanophycinase